mmetsp:Transcript_394/g.906  ORF Transcript_394/g.906 Transcript_394/m.906 type:complete len:413 (-) Transcript_394:311-1549(-)
MLCAMSQYQGHCDGKNGCEEHNHHPDQGEIREVVDRQHDVPTHKPQPPRSSPPPSSASRNRPPARRVDHTYREYSNLHPSELPIRKKAPTTFPSKLHQILSSSAYTHILSWMPHGRAWKIHNKELLVREVISEYFVQSKFESFSRQLNGWGFKRLHQSGNDHTAYYHECFLRGLPHLTVLMSRVTSNLGKQIPHVEEEPNFYEIDKQFPLSTPPVMPYHGHYNYSPAHMGNSAGYGATSELSIIRAPPAPPPGPELSVGYYNQYSSYPSNYPPLPPYHGHHGGPPPAAPYAPLPDYPPLNYATPTQYSHPPPQPCPRFPSPPVPQVIDQLRYEHPSSNTREVHLNPLPHGLVREVFVPTPNNDEANENDLEQISLLLENQTMSSISTAPNVTQRDIMLDKYDGKDVASRGTL